MEDDLAFLGLIPDSPIIRDCEVWPENWETVVLFAALVTQWRFAGMMGVRVGLDYAGVEAMIRLYQVEKPKEVFRGIQIMERAALVEFNRQLEEKSNREKSRRESK